MKRALLVVPMVVAVACSLPAWASNPGEPIDCSDFVFLVPGLSCTEFISECFGVPDEIGNVGNQDPMCNAQQGTATDLEGNLYRLRSTRIGSGSCNGGANYRYLRLELLRRGHGEQEATVVAYADSRCNPDGVDTIKISDGVAHRIHSFDAVNGRILFFVASEGHEYPPGLGDSKYWVAAISGFTTTFEILQTYEPTSGPLSFRVPYMPEGFQAASYFDTYYGDLATVGDWSEAQPLQCGYPASPPGVGDYLTVADFLPDPPVNTGRYYITAANYMGQRRYGRQNNGGVLSGRNPANLPLCEQTEEQP